MWRDKDIQWDDDDDYDVGNKEKTKDNDDGCVMKRWWRCACNGKAMIANETDGRRK